MVSFDQLSKTGMSPINATAVAMAYVASFAATYHTNQTRKSGGSYICHPLDVMTALAEQIFRANDLDSAPEENLDILRIAALHDTLEDTKCTHFALAEEFGYAVADAVNELTDDKNLPKDVRKALCIEHSSGLSRMAALVKIADVCDNCKGVLGKVAPDGWGEERIAAYGKWGSQVVEGAYSALNNPQYRHLPAVDQSYAQGLIKDSPLEIDEHGKVSVRVIDTP